MDVSEVCPTVDAIKAFLEYLVDPLLQEDHSTSDDLPLSQHEKVANQVFFFPFTLNLFFHTSKILIDKNFPFANICLKSSHLISKLKD
jgi:hypothetical protein